MTFITQPNISSSTQRKVLITGASSGIGRQLAIELGRRGYKLVLAARRKEELDRTAELAKASGAPDAMVVAIDLSTPENATELWKQANEHGHIDILILNAGLITRSKPVDKISWEEFDTTVKVNFTISIALMLSAIPDMVKRQSGQIIGISSIAAFRGLPNYAIYSASKAALSTFLESARVDLKPKGVHVGVVSPGFVITDAIHDEQKTTLPFIVSSEKAATIIAYGIEKKKRYIDFPWPMILLLRIGRNLPCAWWDWASLTFLGWYKIK